MRMSGKLLEWLQVLADRGKSAQWALWKFNEKDIPTIKNAIGLNASALYVGLNRVLGISADLTGQPSHLLLEHDDSCEVVFL